MNNYANNEERTLKYLEQFNREKVLKSLVKKSSPIIFDVGANKGSSLIEFKKWWPDSIIHSFEPQDECWDTLNKLKLNFLQNTIFINEIAVGKFSGEKLLFYTHDVSSGISGFNKVNMKSEDSIEINKFDGKKNLLSDYATKFNHKREVETIRLDDYCSDLGIEKIDLIKIDTQGFEPEVLDGLGDKLKNVGVVISELMFYDYYERSLSFSDIEKFLLPANFILFDINHISKNPMNGRTDWVDVIYINKNYTG